jgi:Ca-activated chloride channel family protein
MGWNKENSIWIGAISYLLMAAACLGSNERLEEAQGGPGSGGYSNEGGDVGSGGVIVADSGAETMADARGGSGGGSPGGSGGTSGSGGDGHGASAGSGGLGGSGASSGAGGTAAGGSSGTSGSGGTTGGTGGVEQDASADVVTTPSEDAGVFPGTDPDASTVHPLCSDLDPAEPYVLYLSADDSNSMASPVIARNYILRKAGLIPSSILRTYEFLNYYNVVYTPPSVGSLHIVSQARPGLHTTDVELQIGVVSWPASLVRRPITLTFVIDTSGSMDGNPIFFARATVRAIAGSLQKNDIVNAVTWNTHNTVQLAGHVVTGPDDPALIGLANNLKAAGATDLHAGLVAGYALAEQHYGAKRINRVVLISDGIANVGVTDEAMIAEKAADQNAEGIYLVGVGVGHGVNDTLMDTVTDAGNGAYVFIDSENEANKMFGPRFDEVMEVAARAVQVEARLPWYYRMQAFHGEQFDTDPSKVKPQHLAPGDAMVFHQVLRACAQGQINNTDPFHFTARWVEPLTYQPREDVLSTTLDEMYAASDAQLRRGRAIVAYAELLKAIPAMPSSKRKPAIDGTIAILQSVNTSQPSADLAEMIDLLQKYKSAPGM